MQGFPAAVLRSQLTHCQTAILSHCPTSHTCSNGAGIAAAQAPAHCFEFTRS